MIDSRLSAGLGATGDSAVFTDLNRLNQFKVGAERDSEGNIRKVAQEFESLFLNQMMKAMRSANEVFAEGNFLNSNESKTYQDMHDQQLALTLSQNQGIGLADVLSRQLSKTTQPRARSNPFAQIEGAASAAAPQVQVAAEGFKPDQAQLINQRRLALPARLGDRLMAGILPSGAEGKPLSGQDWVAATAYPAPEGRRLQPAENAATVAASGSRKSFSTPQEFVATMLPMAEAAAKKIGVDPSYLVAQAALETGWGKTIIRQGDGTTSHNLFGIKSHGSWQGESARVLTTEYRQGQAVKESASFRAYDSYQQSFEDFVSFLQSNGRYERALDSAGNGEQFARELQKAGYATDPDYARKISQIARKLQTYQMIAAADGGVTRS